MSRTRPNGNDSPSLKGGGSLLQFAERPREGRPRSAVPRGFVAVGPSRGRIAGTPPDIEATIEHHESNRHHLRSSEQEIHAGRPSAERAPRRPAQPSRGRLAADRVRPGCPHGQAAREARRGPCVLGAEGRLLRGPAGRGRRHHRPQRRRQEHAAEDPQPDHRADRRVGPRSGAGSPRCWRSAPASTPS